MHTIETFAFIIKVLYTSYYEHIAYLTVQMFEECTCWYI